MAPTMQLPAASAAVPQDVGVIPDAINSNNRERNTLAQPAGGGGHVNHSKDNGGGIPKGGGNICLQQW